MKIIFLDIDGVLNSKKSCIKNNNVARRFPETPHPSHIQWLNLIVQKTDAKVVLSSTWRTMCTPEMMDRLLDCYGFDGEIISKTPDLNSHRGTEIKTWLAVHKDKCEMYKDSQWYVYKEPVESFVILDDGTDMGDLLPYLVKTNPDEGLTEKDAKAAIEMLNKGE